LSSLEGEVRAGLSGRYEIDGELGRGGMAVVFRATDLRHKRRVAIKVLDPGLAEGPGAERFRREIAAVARLSHPHILPVLDSGVLPGDPPRAWFAMPYVAGGSLRQRLQREGPLPVADAVRIVAEVAEALDYAHREGLIHRDIKPENVLLQEGQAVVADFGIVGTVEGDPAGRLTKTGSVMGTPRYMSPEQATGSESLDRRTDIYSLGCVLYEALTGTTPFAGAATPASLLAKVMTEDPPPVSRDRPTAASLDPVVAKAMARIAADRYGTAGEIARALRANTPPEGIATAPAVSGATPGTTARVGWRRLAVPAVVACVAVGAWALWSNRSREPVSTFVSRAPSDHPSLVVLPFDNLSPDPDDAYFAAGIQEEIRTQLSKVSGIRLIVGPSGSRSGAAADLPSDLAEKLGVSTVLGGSVRREGSDVRIAVQLYEAVGNEQLWGQIYERELSNIFQVQMDVAAQVVEEIRGVLGPEEMAELAGPTRHEPDPDAFLEYLRGNNHIRSLFSRERAQAAVDAYARAVEIDPQFPAAWSRLVQARLFLSFVWGESEQRESARADLARLEELAPGSAELRMARGLWLYQGVQRYQEARTEFEALAEEWPGDGNVLLYLGAAQRRLGRWEEGTQSWKRALELEPLNGTHASNLAQAYTVMRRFGDAERFAARSVILGPDVAVQWWHYAWVFLAQGDTASARMVVDSARAQLGRDRLEAGGWWALWQVHTGHLERVLDGYGELYVTDPRWDGTWSRSWDLGLAGAATAGDTERVQSFAESLRRSSEDVLATLPDDDPENRSEVLSKLALAEAYLGNGDRAIDLAREAVDHLPVSRDASFGPAYEKVLAQVLAVTGHPDEAVERLRYLLSIPAEVYVDLLKVSPRWTMLRDHPGFQALLAEEGGGVG
jgi:serine/threonine protein kinase/tetratricopeptide (TPR) repeat protein